MTPLQEAARIAREPFDCQKCGACCMTAGEVIVTENDLTPKRLTRSVRNMIGFASWEADFGVRAMKRKDGRCVALKGVIGSGCSCSIYTLRPDVCSGFIAGSDECHEARQGWQEAERKLKEAQNG